VAALYPHLEREILDSINTHLVLPFSLPSIEVSQLGTDACAIGSAMILHQRQMSFDEHMCTAERARSRKSG
jgi:hypothetical protein